MALNTPILTYHSQNVHGAGPANNDHDALREDLEALHSSGRRIVPLGLLLDCLDERAPASEMEGAVCLTFDDGCDFDARDLDYPGHGVQRSFLGIMRDFVGRQGPDAQPLLHATSFVIADPGARRIIDEKSLYGKGWISDDWWAETAATGLLAIGNHGWDHNHPDLFPYTDGTGGFASVDTLEVCEQQVIRAAESIAGKTGKRPELFAYPFGESSAYIREVFFPQHGDSHRCRAALGTDPGFVTEESDRWNLPRFVCGRDWRSPDQLLELIRGDSSRSTC